MPRSHPQKPLVEPLLHREAMSARGSASVEQIALCALIALAAMAAISSLSSGRLDSGRELGTAIARRIACGPRIPDSCRHHPLVPAYGWPLARVVRALAPAPSIALAPGGEALLPVDFRYCRRVSCARPGDAHLTSSGRRTTAFTTVADRRRVGGDVAITYWLYRPSLGWARVDRVASAVEIAAAAGTMVVLSQDPALVPLEILPGRNEYEFPAGEEPPWLWHVTGVYPGWSS